MKEYFKAKAISNSLLSRVGFFFQEQMLDKFSNEHEEKETLSMFMGSQIHKAIETGGKSLENLKVLDTTCFNETDENGKSLITAFEAKVLKSEDPYTDYFNVYGNEASKIAKAAWDKPTLSAKEAKCVQGVKDHITDILFKGSSYLNSRIGILEDDLILNEYKLTGGKETYISDPDKCKYIIESCYNSVVMSSAHQDIIDRDLFEECIEHFELEYYDQIDGYAVKGMFDRVIILPEQKRAVLIDYKTYGNSTIEKSILKYNYCRQLSWYLKLFEMWLRDNNFTGFTVDTYIVGISTDSYKITTVPLSIKALQASMYGGYIKPPMYTIYTDEDEFDPFLNEADVEWLKLNGIWSTTKNNQFKRFGWRELFDIGIESEIFDEFKL